MTRPVRHAALAVLIALVLGLGAAHADDDAAEHRAEDFERARAALEAGQIRPLSEILAIVAERHPGEVVAAEFEDEHDRWIYEVKLIDRSGRLVVVEVDAATATILDVDDDE